MKEYDDPTRPVFEFRSAMGWLAALIGALIIGLSNSGSIGAAITVMAVCLVPLLIRLRKAKQFFLQRLNLSRYYTTWIPLSDLLRKNREHPEDQWLGYGFDWTPECSQLAHEFAKTNLQKIAPPHWFQETLTKLRGEQTISETGLPWIHSLAPEKELTTPIRSRTGNMMILGLPGSGKTQLMKLHMLQDIHRDFAVIVEDPKNDPELREFLREQARSAGRPFVCVDLANPGKSHRLRGVSNWQQVSEVASRITGALESEQGASSFSSFAWMAINTVAGGLELIGEKPTLRSITRHVQGGPDELLEDVLERWLEQNVPNYEQYLRDAGKPKNASNRLTGRGHAMVRLYRNSKTPKSTAINSLLAMVEHSREHYSKMIQNVQPLLTALTAGQMGELLSPSPDPNDSREIWDMSRIIEVGAVCYIGLNMMTNRKVGASVGALLNAELAATAGSIYNYSTAHRNVSLYIDEAVEVLNDPLIQLANKSRGAKFTIQIAVQTYSDFAAGLNSSDKAAQFAGNFQNLVVLRSSDSGTQEYVESMLPETEILSVTQSHSSVAGTKDAGLHFAGNQSETQKAETVKSFPPHLLGSLADLHFIAKIAGGRWIKGRIPLIET